MKKTVAILFGGNSTEHEVSLKSAYSVLAHLDTTRYEPIYIGITRGGEWLRYQGPLDAIPTGDWELDSAACTPAAISPCRVQGGLLELAGSSWSRIPIDIAFPVLHGRNGEDGTIQGLLELAGIPYVGCGTLSSALCMDKVFAHIIAEAAGVKSARYTALHQAASVDAASLAQRVQGFAYPLFVKPARSGSSYGISKVEQLSQLEAAVALAFEHDDKVLIEEAVSGFEVGCAILGHGKELIIGKIDEIELQDGFFDYQEKYTLQTSRIHMPARISEAQAAAVAAAAEKLYHAFGCSGLARVDLFLAADEELYFNEINTLPGFTAHSRYPNMLRGIGLAYQDVIGQLLHEAETRL